MSVTLRSVARLAGVSTSTASRALSGHVSVRPDTRAKVTAAASTLRYHPNRMAQSLRTRRTGLIGLVVNNLWNATFNTIAETIQASGTQHGYQVLVCTTGGEPRREAAFLDTAMEHHFEGVVIAGSGANDDRINALLDAGMGVVTMNREVPGARAPSVMPDYTRAARLATEHLLSLGHRRIAAIAGLDRFTSGRQQHAGFLAAMSAAALPVSAELLHRGPFTPEFGSAAAGRLLSLARPPTALLVSNHEAAFGVLPVLTRAAVDIPGRMSLVCTEDEPWFAWWHPPLTVVDNRAAFMAEVACTRLMAQLPNGASTPTGEPGSGNGPGGGQTDGVPGDLVQPQVLHRASTGPPLA